MAQINAYAAAVRQEMLQKVNGLVNDLAPFHRAGVGNYCNDGVTLMPVGSKEFFLAMQRMLNKKF